MGLSSEEMTDWRAGMLPDIPPTDFYAGMLRHDLGNGRMIQVYGSGPEAERALQQAVANQPPSPRIEREGE